jgi:hypothetical protein
MILATSTALVTRMTVQYPHQLVMPALVAGIHVLRHHDQEDVDGWDRPAMTIKRVNQYGRSRMANDSEEENIHSH